MVQLKAINNLERVVGEQFQFLYGTIKRAEGFGISFGLYQFQFLYGTIKS